MKLPHSYSFEAIGTQWSIETLRPLDTEMQLAIADTIDSFDQLFSRFRKDSIITDMSLQAGTYTFPEWTLPLWEWYEKLYDMTDGKVTPLIGGALEKAGYDATYSFIARPQTALPSWDDAIERNGVVITMKRPALLDLGAAGKGFLVDCIARVVDDAGHDSYVIDASGDIRHKGTHPDMVGLEHPSDPAKIIGSIQLSNRSLCASAINRRQWGSDMHHVFDPDTLSPTKEVIATWVVADDTMTADGLATALFFVDPDQLTSAGAFDFVRVHADGTLDYSKAFEGQLV